MPAKQYSVTNTRTGMQGCVDKLVIVDRMATRYSTDRELQTFVLNRIRKAGNAADLQVKAWANYCESLPYRREPVEIFRSPTGSGGTMNVGGDCDDLVILFLAGCRALAIPAEPEIMADKDGHGYHIRAKVGLPPMNPTVWVTVDPVWKSEQQWAMKHRTIQSSSRRQKIGASGLAGAAPATVAATVETGPADLAVTCQCPPLDEGMPWWAAAAGSAVIFLLVKRQMEGR